MSYGKVVRQRLHSDAGRSGGGAWADSIRHACRDRLSHPIVNDPLEAGEDLMSISIGDSVTVKRYRE